MKWFAGAAAVFALVVFLSLPTSGQDFGEKVDRIFDGLEASKGRTLFQAVQQLKELGRSATEEIRGGLRRADPYVRIAAASCLYSHDFRDEAVDALLLVGTQSKNAEARTTAATILSTVVKQDINITRSRKKEISDKIIKSAREVEDKTVQIHLWAAAYNLTQNLIAKRNMITIFKEAEAKEAKDKSSLALAEMDGFLVSGMKAHLKELSKEPSADGKLAKVYLELDRLEEEIQRAYQNKPDTGTYDYALLTEVLDTLGEYYHDPKKIEAEQKRLIEQAARGVAASLDPYTSYYDQETIKALRDDLTGEYGGIGARVSMRKDRGGTSWLTIEEPIFSGPAYEAGIRSNDKIIEVEGQSTANKDLTELVTQLRGKPGTKVKIKVFSLRWEDPKDMEITRGRVMLETVKAALLPGGIGYLQLSTFGPDEDEKLAKEIRRFENKGARALVLDMRGNSGGYLDTAIRISNLFIDRGETVVSIKSENTGTRDVNHRTSRRKLTDLPMAVLIDGGSASASEIVAGAIRDHDRGILVGEKSYGKGSVQRLYYLDTTGRDTAVRVTIAKWYLPKGESIEKEEREKSGIEPDVEAKFPDPDLFKIREFERLRANPAIEKYIQDKFEANKEAFRELAETDGGDWKRYPGFEELYSSMKTRADKTEVRELLRDYVRRAVQDDRKQEFACDFQIDDQLQVAIQEVAKRARINVGKIEAYKTFAKAKGKAEDY